MSMLSSRCDRLREIADHLEGDPRTQHTAPEVRDAADTIWELRNKCNDLLDERDELKEENAKLRELVRDMDVCISHGAGWDCNRCPRNDAHECDFDIRMDELGVPR